jgi:hypothetical protein
MSAAAMPLRNLWFVSANVPRITLNQPVCRAAAVALEDAAAREPNVAPARRVSR